MGERRVLALRRADIGGSPEYREADDATKGDVIEIGPRGGKIVGYTMHNGKRVPVYEGTPGTHTGRFYRGGPEETAAVEHHPGGITIHTSPGVPLGQHDSMHYLRQGDEALASSRNVNELRAVAARMHHDKSDDPRKMQAHEHLAEVQHEHGERARALTGPYPEHDQAALEMLHKRASEDYLRKREPDERHGPNHIAKELARRKALGIFGSESPQNMLDRHGLEHLEALAGKGPEAPAAKLSAQTAERAAPEPRDDRPVHRLTVKEQDALHDRAMARAQADVATRRGSGEAPDPPAKSKVSQTLARQIAERKPTLAMEPQQTDLAGPPSRKTHVSAAIQQAADEIDKRIGALERINGRTGEWSSKEHLTRYLLAAERGVVELKGLMRRAESEGASGGNLGTRLLALQTNLRNAQRHLAERRYRTEKPRSESLPLFSGEPKPNRAAPQGGQGNLFGGSGGTDPRQRSLF